MPQTRIFRDRVVSMEQTLEGGEKHLDLLKALCREALPDWDYVDHSLDHERDLFAMTLRSADGRTKLVSWTRMMLFDVERLPVLATDPVSPLRERLLQYIRARSARPEIVVTFRHMEEGWVDTPEPRREKRRRRPRRPERHAEAGGRPQPGRPTRRPGAGPRPDKPGGAHAEKPGGVRPEKPQPARRESFRPAQPARPAPGAPPQGQATRPPGRRRLRRRRRGGGRAGGAPSGQPPGAP